MASPGREPIAATARGMAALMRDKDWSATSLGPAEHWPQSLRTIARVLLTSRFAMWMGWGEDLTFLYNDAYGAMTLGAKHPWALGRPSREVWAEIWPEIGPRVTRVLRDGEATWDKDLLLFLERSGYPEETYHTFSYSPVADDSGATAGLLCVVSEETERVVGERRMAMLRDSAAAVAASNSEAELFAAIGRTLTGSKDLPFSLIYLLDENGTRARLVSQAGIEAGHPAALAEIDLVDPEVKWPIRLTQLGSAPAVIELDGRFEALPHGPWHQPPTHAVIAPIGQSGQGLSGVLVAALNRFRPIDDDYRSFVELLVGQIAAGLANVRTYEEERRRAAALAELDRAKTTFFSNVSHEFRTPLTLLMGPLEDLRRMEGALPDSVQQQLEVAHRNSQRLLKLVNTLLEFSRIEAGRVRAQFQPLDFAGVTADFASTFRSAMQRAGLEFVVEAPPLGEPVYLDREMWEKVVLNLISNAFKFTLKGQVRVRVSREGDRGVLTVADTGAGIPASELPLIFGRFHRVEGARGRSHEGSGIGLALVQELVRLHGGELSAESQEGEGTTFRVSLPFGHAHLPADQIVDAAAAVESGAASSFVAEALRWLPSEEDEGRTAVRAASVAAAATAYVLLADDNHDMRDYAHRLLAEHWEVAAVSNGRLALAAARRRRPDIIVTDVMMPELDGFGLLRELRTDPGLQSIPVIMLSARAGEEARLEGLAASADDYLVKPFTARDLVARVDAQLVKARARDLEQRHAARMASLFANAPVAIALVRGPDHIFELANHKYRELVGGRELVGLTIRDALPELAGQGIYELLDRVRQSGEPYVGQSLPVLIRRPPGDEPVEYAFDFVYQPIFDAAGRVDTIVVIAYDVTSLSQAKREAESANRLKDEFLATLSHELRTPLNAVLGYTQMLRGGVIPPERLAPVLETIERNAKLQEQLISDVLDVSRIITGKLRLDVAPVSLPRVINEALETVSPAAMAKGVRLQATIDQSGVPVAGDAQRLQQVVWNLLANAIKFTPRGGRVQVMLQRVHSQVEISVSDTGEGIAPEFLPFLFERFRQADSAFTRAHGGLGLGLAICRHLVEAHGGRIDAVSPGKGRGTTVRVELPLMIVHDEDPEGLRVHPAIDILPAPAALDLADLSGRRVLLVDDDADALQMARDVLAAAGAAVVTASSADEALAALDRERFDAAVLDIGLPAVDGYELLRRIRSRPRDKQGCLPAAALTAYARTADRTRSLQTGFQLHLSKPVQPNELAAAVHALTRSELA